MRWRASEPPVSTTMANANGCESVSCSIETFCGTPLSVRRKSSAVRSKITLPSLVTAKTGTITNVERTTTVGWLVPLCCAMPRVVVQSRRVAPQKTLRKLDFALWVIRSPQAGEHSSVRLIDDTKGCQFLINAVVSIGRRNTQVEPDLH